MSYQEDFGKSIEETMVCRARLSIVSDKSLREKKGFSFLFFF